MCNHCPYVIPKVPELVRLQKKYAAQGLRSMGINANDVKKYPEDSFENMKKFAREKKIVFPYLFDETQHTARAYGAACTPDPFLFDADVKLAYHGRIDDAHQLPAENAKSHELEDAIRAVLDKKPVPGNTQPARGCNVKWKA